VTQLSGSSQSWRSLSSLAEDICDFLSWTALANYWIKWRAFVNKRIKLSILWPSTQHVWCTIIYILHNMVILHVSTLIFGHHQV
jgi:hypothetical protein